MWLLLLERLVVNRRESRAALLDGLTYFTPLRWSRRRYIKRTQTSSSHWRMWSGEDIKCFVLTTNPKEHIASVRWWRFIFASKLALLVFINCLSEYQVISDTSMKRSTLSFQNRAGRKCCCIVVILAHMSYCSPLAVNQTPMLSEVTTIFLFRVGVLVSSRPPLPSTTRVSCRKQIKWCMYEFLN